MQHISYGVCRKSTFIRHGQSLSVQNSHSNISVSTQGREDKLCLISAQNLLPSAPLVILIRVLHRKNHTNAEIPFPSRIPVIFWHISYHQRAHTQDGATRSSWRDHSSVFNRFISGLGSSNRKQRSALYSNSSLLLCFFCSCAYGLHSDDAMGCLTSVCHHTFLAKHLQPASNKSNIFRCHNKGLSSRQKATHNLSDLVTAHFIYLIAPVPCRCLSTDNLAAINNYPPMNTRHCNPFT